MTEGETTKLLRELRYHVGRFVVARDEKGYHVRQTLCVTHDGVSGESRYDTKPLASGRTLPVALRRSIASARRAGAG